VAVDKWQWWQSKEESEAVRMVPVGEWQWQYRQSCGGLKRNRDKKKKREKKKEYGGWQSTVGIRSGSGRVAVVPVERGDQGGSNGGS
jgi:hypothetical protein